MRAHRRLPSVVRRRTRRDPSDSDLARLASTAFRLIDSAVDCAFVSVLYRSTGDGMLREFDSRGRSYPSAFMRRYAELTPAVGLALRNPGRKLLHSRDGLPADTAELLATPFYREVMQPQGWRHAVALCFWGHPPAPFPVLVLTANRGPDDPDFTAVELRALANVHDVLDGWVSDLLEHTSATEAYAAAAALARTKGRGFLVLDRRMSIRLADGAGRKTCQRWAGENRRGGTSRVPPAIVDACRGLYASWLESIARDTPIPERGRVTLCRNTTLGIEARITMCMPHSDGVAEPTFFVEIRDLARAPRTAVAAMPRFVARFTEAEQPVVELLIGGLSNKEIAARLDKSVHAVKFLLHNIYTRTGVPNRTQLALAMRRRR